MWSGNRGVVSLWIVSLRKVGMEAARGGAASSLNLIVFFFFVFYV